MKWGKPDVIQLAFWTGGGGRPCADQELKGLAHHMTDHHLERQGTRNLQETARTVLTMDTFISLIKSRFRLSMWSRKEFWVSTSDKYSDSHLSYHEKKTDTVSDAQFLMDSQEPNSFLIKSNCHNFSTYNEGFFSFNHRYIFSQWLLSNSLDRAIEMGHKVKALTTRPNNEFHTQDWHGVGREPTSTCCCYRLFDHTVTPWDWVY